MLEQQLKNFENNKTLIKVMNDNTHLYKIKTLEMEIKKSLDKEVVSQFFDQSKIWQEFVEGKCDDIRTFFIDLDC